MLAHNAGRGENALGTFKREHVLYTVILDLEVEQVLEMANARISVRDIAAELGIGKSKVSRIQAKLKEEGRL